MFEETHCCARSGKPMALRKSKMNHMVQNGKIKLFSFFSGAGFLDYGFESEGYEVVLVNEFVPAFCHAYQFARERLGIKPPIYGYSRDVNDYLSLRSDELKGFVKDARKDGSIVGFIGGPPCPDFSIAGRQRGRDGDNGKLSLSYVQIIIEQQPDFFLFENVKGLWKTAKHREYYEELKAKLADAGYQMTDRLVNALEFGAPQDRDRIILIGIKSELLKSDLGDFPWTKYAKYSLEEIKSKSWPTQNEFKEDSVSIAPKDVPIEITVEYWFKKNDVLNHPNGGEFFIPHQGLSRMLTIQEGDDKKKSYKRLHRWRYSPTVAYGNNEVHLHPYKPRRISVAEAASLQSLPKEFVFPPETPLSAKFKMIGNGVPFLLSAAIAKTLRDYFKS